MFIRTIIYPTDAAPWPLRIILNNKSKYCKINNIQWYSNIKLLSETNTCHTEINHVPACPGAQIEAEDAKKVKRGRLALDSLRNIQMPNIDYILELRARLIAYVL